MNNAARKLLYENTEFNVGVDGMLSNPNNLPLTNIIYILAKECEDLQSQLDDYNTIVERFLIASGKSKDLTEPDEFEEVFEDIEATYSECEELKTQLKQVKYLYEVQDEKLIDELATENNKYKQAIDEIENIADDYNRACKTSQYYRDGFDQIQDIINKVKE